MAGKQYRGHQYVMARNQPDVIRGWENTDWQCSSQNPHLELITFDINSEREAKPLGFLQKKSIRPGNLFAGSTHQVQTFSCKQNSSNQAREGWECVSGSSEVAKICCWPQYQRDTDAAEAYLVDCPEARDIGKKASSSFLNST